MIEETIDLVVNNNLYFNIIGAAVGSVGAAAAASFAIPTIADLLQPLPIQDRFADFLPYISMLPDGKTISCIHNVYMQVIEIDGTELNLAAEVSEIGQSRADLFLARKYMLDEIHKYGIDELRLFQLKYKQKLDQPPHNSIPVLDTVNQLWANNFKNTYKLRTYMFVSTKTKSPEQAQERLEKATQFIKTSLRSYNPEILSEPLDGALIVEPEKRPLAVIAKIVSPIGQPKPLGLNYHDRISDLLTADHINFTVNEKKGVIKITNGEREKYAVVLGIRDCGDKTPESIMKNIIALPLEMNVFQLVRPHDPTGDIAHLKIEQANAPFMRFSMSAAAEVSSALEMVEGQDSQNRATLHDYAFNVIVYGDTIKECLESEAQIQAALTASSATTVREYRSAQATYFTQFGGDKMWPRTFRYMSQNVAANMYLQKPNEGIMSSNWADRPICWLKTVDGQPYAFQFHGEPSSYSEHTLINKETTAHCALIGPTGAGKTTMMTFLSAMATSIPTLRVYMFDRLKGCEAFVRCSGGSYITFDGQPGSAQMNPLKQTDNGENRAFLRRWLRLFDAKMEIDHEVIADIQRLIETIYDPHISHQHKTLANLAMTTFQPGGKMRNAVKPWIDAEQYGGYFNAQKDTLDIKSNRIIGFDMTTVLNDEQLAPLVIDYVIHKIRAVSKDTDFAPSLIFIDETAPMLSANPRFAENFLKVGLQEGRKQRQAYCVSFQGPRQVELTGLGPIIRQQCPTVFLFPNKNSKAEDYREWNLTEAELSFVTGKEYREFPYAVLIKKYNIGQSAIVNLDISILGKYLKMFSSSNQAVAELNRCEEKYGSNFLDHYLNGTEKTVA
jgi:type IV secretion system protein VirB4